VQAPARVPNLTVVKPVPANLLTSWGGDMAGDSGLEPKCHPAEAREVNQAQAEADVAAAPVASDAVEGGGGIHRAAEATSVRSWCLWSSLVGLAMVVVVALVAGPISLPSREKVLDGPHPRIKDPLAEVRADADSAIQALGAGDLAALDVQLADHRGQADFAYLFASQTTPRALGDSLAGVAGKRAPLKEGIDAHAYDVVLTDLAGTVGLATFGTGDRALPTKWTDDFITATTDPAALHEEAARDSGDAGRLRHDQDLANKQNLLLLLSRGYWSTGFLQAVTDAYWHYDQGKGDDAWPDASVGDGKVAPAPTGHYLTDGIVALTAALTANPEASAWAFTEFLPGTKRIAGSDHAIGKFTHYLLFEHDFPESSVGESLGMTATLTALSSAIDATSGTTDAKAANEIGPSHDSDVLQTMAKEIADKNRCSWNPRDYWNCAVAVAEAVMHWIGDWGHLVLEVLSLATFAPPPFNAIGVAAAVTNATWHAIDGDYVAAGLSLATAVPGLAFGKIAKIAKGAKAERAALKAAAEADDIAKAANEFRTAIGAGSKVSKVVTEADLKVRPNLLATTKNEVLANAKRNWLGKLVDPNTGEVILGKYDFGHKPGYEWRCLKTKALELGWTLQELSNRYNNPAHLQIEDPASNQSHRYESDVCAA
jgi:hypothetical protein